MADVPTHLTLTGHILRVNLILAEGTLLVVVRLQLIVFKLVRMGELLLKLDCQLAL